jgi:L,D-peptidoglycan transpeptidase YkuD (ErfK/YbiS/YcfS/YnhG family)
MFRLNGKGDVRAAWITTLGLVLPLSGAPVATAAPADILDSLPIGTTQIVEVTAGSWRTTSARLRAWQRRGSGWKRVIEAPARVGANGLVPAKRRKQNTSTTPAGTFAFTHAFGVGSAPVGIEVPYLRVTKHDYWVYDPLDPDTYNSWVVGRSQRDAWRVAQAEHLITYKREYRYALVIDYNNASGVGRPDTTAGGGIFLHVNGDGPTAGCVSVPKATMARILRWLDPSAGARIVIRVDM